MPAHFARRLIEVRLAPGVLVWVHNVARFPKPVTEPRSIRLNPALIGGNLYERVQRPFMDGDLLASLVSWDGAGLVCVRRTQRTSRQQKRLKNAPHQDDGGSVRACMLASLRFKPTLLNNRLEVGHDRGEFREIRSPKQLLSLLNKSSVKKPQCRAAIVRKSLKPDSTAVCNKVRILFHLLKQRVSIGVREDHLRLSDLGINSAKTRKPVSPSNAAWIGDFYEERRKQGFRFLCRNRQQRDG